MKIFAIICLIIILITIQHLLNWLWRKSFKDLEDKDEGFIIVAIFASIFLGFISYGCGYYIIQWINLP